MDAAVNGPEYAGDKRDPAVFLALPGYDAIATLGLRMDYWRPAVAGQDLHVAAECHHVSRSVAFARGTLYQADRDRPTALCTAAFMRTGVLPT